MKASASWMGRNNSCLYLPHVIAERAPTCGCSPCMYTIAIMHYTDFGNMTIWQSGLGRASACARDPALLLPRCFARQQCCFRIAATGHVYEMWFSVVAERCDVLHNSSHSSFAKIECESQMQPTIPSPLPPPVQSSNLAAI